MAGKGLIFYKGMKFVFVFWVRVVVITELSVFYLCASVFFVCCLLKGFIISFKVNTDNCNILIERTIECTIDQKNL